MALSGSGGGASLAHLAEAQTWIQSQPHKQSDAVYIMLHQDGVIDGKIGLRVYAGQFEPYKPDSDIHVIVYVNVSDPQRLSLAVPDLDSALTEDAVAFCFVNEPRSVAELLSFVAAKYSETHRLQQLEESVDVGNSCPASDEEEYGIDDSDEDYVFDSDDEEDALGSQGSAVGGAAAGAGSDADSSAGSAAYHPPAPPSLGSQRSYRVLTKDDLYAAQASLIESTAQQYGVSISDATALLRRARWDAVAMRANLNNTGTVSRAEFLASAGVSMGGARKQAPLPEASEEDPFECPVCMDDLESQEDIFALPCGHAMCKGCWREKIAQDVQSAECLVATCPIGACKEPMSETAFREFTTAAQFSQYLRFLADSFVDDNDSVTWCPNPDCDKVVAFSRSKRTVECSCGRVFCFKCHNGAHAPAVCHHRKQWLDKSKQRDDKVAAMKGDTESVLSKKDGAAIKMCPNPDCRVPTQKNGGCMYLQCSTCKQPWCWQCGEWGPKVHHVSTCNAPPNKDWLEASQSQLFDNEGRFDWYRQRFRNHQDSLKFAEGQRREAGLKKRQLIMSGVPAVHVQFLLDSVELVVRCRRTLAWTYVFAFFVKDAEARALFEHSQGMLENHTEKLSELTEKDAIHIRDNRQDILNYSKALQKYLSSMEVYEFPAEKQGGGVGAAVAGGDDDTGAAAAATAAPQASGAGSGSGAKKPRRGRWK